MLNFTLSKISNFIISSLYTNKRRTNWNSELAWPKQIGSSCVHRLSLRIKLNENIKILISNLEYFMDWWYRILGATYIFECLWGQIPLFDTHVPGAAKQRVLVDTHGLDPIVVWGLQVILGGHDSCSLLNHLKHLKVRANS